ncbi:MAG: M23 family metallopeptidase [Candidatus Woesearchaeota archaeon]|jgi:murein DD-endopeptidase MepM/ murein hydrolase activator NlpD
MNRKTVWIIAIVVVLVIIVGGIILFNVLNKKPVQIEQKVGQLSISNQEKFLQSESRITITLPFSKEDEVIGMTPMGETVYHPVAGHPGFDFGWSHNAPIRASADGIITDIIAGTEEGGKWGVVLKSGQYFIEYGGLEKVYSNLAVGSSVKQGDIIGYPETKPNDKGGVDYAIHWEIKPAYQYSERLCPTTYFDDESNAR